MLMLGNTEMTASRFPARNPVDAFAADFWLLKDWLGEDFARHAL